MKHKHKFAPNPLKVEKLGVILEPTERSFENVAVLNPGCYQEGEYVHIFYRAISKSHRSSIGYAKLKGPTEVVERWKHPIMARDFEYEKKGIEDPRVAKIGNRFYMTYTAHDGKNAVGAYAVSRDLKNFEKKGVISPQIKYDKAADMFRREKLKDRYFMFEAFYEEFAGHDILLWEKDLCVFPKKIDGKFAMLHRILPDVQIIYFNSFADLKKKSFWEQYLSRLAENVVLENKFWFESRNIGGGATPIETEDGWLIIFHAVEELNKSRVYRASAALLNKKDPRKVIGRLDYPLFSPEEKWEKNGFVNNVVFPTGTAIFGDDLYIYYGAADRVIAAAKVNLKDLIRELKKKGKNGTI